MSERVFKTALMVRRRDRGKVQSGNRTSCGFSSGKQPCKDAITVIGGVPMCEDHCRRLNQIERAAALGRSAGR